MPDRVYGVQSVLLLRRDHTSSMADSSSSEDEYDADLCPMVYLKMLQQRRRARALAGLFQQVQDNKLTVEAARERVHKLRATQKQEVFTTVRLLNQLK
jgi:hypothetical protein